MLERLSEFSSDDATPGAIQRVGATVKGRVQGVGFRPFVYRLAHQHALTGFVKNARDSVILEVQGRACDVQKFLEELKERPPDLARVETLEWKNMPTVDAVGGEALFQIQSSFDSNGERRYVSPDIATCEECLRELNDPLDRRHRYPFLNCVSCGPRITILESLPYDRERTVMKKFPLCEACEQEFHDPRDRRFHAQPVACPACGPRIEVWPYRGDGDWLNRCVSALENGECLAIKGIGGYHLVCDATNAGAVRTLRKRKHRDEKPLAIMVADEPAARALCEISDSEWSALNSVARPIVLLRKREPTQVANEVSPASPFLGVMLPYTPLHHLLLQAVKGKPLVMTSANESGQPMAYHDETAKRALEGVADLIIAHDREIRLRCDDSVIRVVDPAESNISVIIRRSRGFVPDPIRLPFTVNAPVLALGAQLKNTFALGHDGLALLSHHVGDLDEWETCQSYTKEIERYEKLFGLRPKVIAHDLHPDYFSTQYGQSRASQYDIPIIAVQHHHAHMASCMADNGLNEKVIAVTLDGTGYGLDGNIWGGEFLIGDYEGFERAAHLAYVPMPGGEQAIREPWRMACAYLARAGLSFDGKEMGISCQSVRTVRQMMERDLNCPLTSSVGRLFDAVAALLRLRAKVSFEGQAAMELEALAMKATGKSGESYPFALVRSEQDGGIQPLVIDVSPLVHGVVADLRLGCHGPEIARRFHQSLVDMIVRVCKELRNDTALDKVVLSGGVFMNGALLSGVVRSLRSQDFKVFFHRQVPPNDGGISLGQLAIAAARLGREKENVFSDPWKVGGDLPRK